MKLTKAPPEDEKIIELLNGNDADMEAGVRILYRHFFHSLKTYILSNSGSEQDAEDIFQDVLIAFVNSVRSAKFRGESAIKTFLFAMNRNLWLNELKKRERKSAREENYEKSLSGQQSNSPWSIESRQSQTALISILNELGESCKKLLLLFYFENRSMNEIAAALDYENEQVARNKKVKCLKKMGQMVHGNPPVYQTLKNYLHE